MKVRCHPMLFEMNGSWLKLAALHHHIMGIHAGAASCHVFPQEKQGLIKGLLTGVVPL